MPGDGIGSGFSRWDFIPVPSSSLGFDITPNYVDASTTSITISPWCSCKGSGNMEEECEKFLRDFTENPCLRKALPCHAPFPLFYHSRPFLNLSRSQETPSKLLGTAPTSIWLPKIPIWR